MIERKKEEQKDVFDQRLLEDFRTNIKFYWKSIRSVWGKSQNTELNSIRDQNGPVVKVSV